MKHQPTEPASAGDGARGVSMLRIGVVFLSVALLVVLVIAVRNSGSEATDGASSVPVVIREYIA